MDALTAESISRSFDGVRAVRDLSECVVGRARVRSFRTKTPTLRKVFVSAVHGHDA
jgi:hypothetical protein